MGLRSTMRREFPRGWWRSGRWWTLGMRELLLSSVVALAAVLCTRPALRVLQAREDPRALARQPVPEEGWAAGVLVSCLGLVFSTYMLLCTSTPLWVFMSLALWCSLNLVVAATSSVVYFRSRWRLPSVWQELDFIEHHAPLCDHPPQTPAEYRAVWLRIKNEES